MDKKVFVLDTSVVVKWYNETDEKHVKEAKQILNDLKAEKITILVPDLIGVELLNVFLKGKKLPLELIKILLGNFFALPIIIKESTEELLIKACIIAQKYNITAYDALFIALSQNENCHLISDDTKAHGKITDGSVLMLRDYSF